MILAYEGDGFVIRLTWAAILFSLSPYTNTSAAAANTKMAWFYFKKITFIKVTQFILILKIRFSFFFFILFSAKSSPNI